MAAVAGDTPDWIRNVRHLPNDERIARARAWLGLTLGRGERPTTTERLSEVRRARDRLSDAIRDALTDGASWPQIVEAMGVDEETAENLKELD